MALVPSKRLASRASDTSGRPWASPCTVFLHLLFFPIADRIFPESERGELSAGLLQAASRSPGTLPRAACEGALRALTCSGGLREGTELLDLGNAFP